MRHDPAPDAKPPSPAVLSLEALETQIGTEVGLSAWHRVSQERIDAFAAVTDDHQFIHVDPERARAETPFGGTVAHGFLTLSLLSAMAYEALPTLEGGVLGLNYGFDRIRFLAPVRAGVRLRARFALKDVVRRSPREVVTVHAVTVEIEGGGEAGARSGMADADGAGMRSRFREPHGRF